MQPPLPGSIAPSWSAVATHVFDYVDVAQGFSADASPPMRDLKTHHHADGGLDARFVKNRTLGQKVNEISVDEERVLGVFRVHLVPLHRGFDRLLAV